MLLLATENAELRAKPCWLKGPKPPNWGKHTGMPPLRVWGSIRSREALSGHMHACLTAPLPHLIALGGL